jgi:transcriptional regulator with XRE-family HTH domain
VALKSAEIVPFKRKHNVCFSTRPAPTVAPAMEFLRNLRERRGLTQAELGERIGRHATTVSQFESARSLPSVEVLSRLARELNISPGKLLDELLTAYRMAHHRSPASVTNLQRERERRKARTDH